MTNTLNPTEEVLHHVGAKSPTPPSSTEGLFGENGKSQFSHLFVIFYLLLSSMHIRQGTVLNQTEELDLNASLQNKLNSENGNIHFSVLSAGAKESTIAQVQNKNQIYAQEKENIQSSLILARQNAQVTMTETTTNVNLMEQDTSENSGWLQTLNTIFQVIDEMSPNSSSSSS